MTFGVPVTLVTIHHEGAGNPVDWARGGEGGYSLWIGDVNGDGVYDVLRNPWVSYATLGFNHVSLDICLSGDRDVAPTTDADVKTIQRAVAQARALGWVVANPLVRAHHDSPGSSTVCPGTHTRDPARWSQIVAACQVAAPTPTPSEPKVTSKYNPPINVLGGIAASLSIGGGTLLIGPLGHLYALDGAPNRGGPIKADGTPETFWVGRQVSDLQHPNAAEAAAGKVYTVIDTTLHRYAFPL